MTTRHTILIVDDEQDVVDSLCHLLRLDHRVLGTTRAEDVLRIMAEQEVHVVMTDQRMPGMSGVELLRQVGELHPATTRLLFSGDADVRALADAVSRGQVFCYVTKPWDPAELQRILQEAVARHDLLAQGQRLLTGLDREDTVKKV